MLSVSKKAVDSRQDTPAPDMLAVCCIPTAGLFAVIQVFSNTSDSSPVLAAVQLRLLQFLLCSNEDEGTDSLLDEVLRLSGQQTQQP